MAFVNIKKVTLPETTDVFEAYADTVLVFASATHDAVLADNREEALSQLRYLVCAAKHLSGVLTRKSIKRKKVRE